MAHVKIPTIEEFEKYTGLHCHKLWDSVGAGYKCPSCGRNKFELLKWSVRFPKKPTRFYSWVATLHRHHDHSDNSPFRNQGRFEETKICGQCNSADGAAKRKLRLPKSFSFSPAEIRQFVSSEPHSVHKIDYERALAIFHRVSA